MAHVFRPQGADNDFVYFWTPSWTRSEHPGHDVVLDRRALFVSCGCEDCRMRFKGVSLLSDGRQGCKHIKAFLRDLGPVLREALLG